MLWRFLTTCSSLCGLGFRIDPAVAGSLRTLLLSLARESQLHRRLATEASSRCAVAPRYMAGTNPRLVGALAPRPVRAARAVTNAPAASSKRALKWVYSANPLEQYRDGAAGLGQAAAESNGSATANVGSQEPRVRGSWRIGRVESFPPSNGWCVPASKSTKWLIFSRRLVTAATRRAQPRRRCSLYAV